MPAQLLLSRDVPLPRSLSISDLRTRLLAMLRAVREQAGSSPELSVLLTGDEHIHMLNRDYRHKNKPTDVLAFAMREGAYGEQAGAVLGDVVVSLETAGRQAKAMERPLLDEVTMLLAHGLLHLLGWDHDTDAKDRAMRAETERLVLAADTASRRLQRQPKTGLTTRNQTKKVAASGAARARSGGAPAGKKRPAPKKSENSRRI